MQYRVAWNTGSGDLYVATHPSGDHLEVLLTSVDRTLVHWILHGWADQAVHGTLNWLRRQTLRAHFSGIGDDARPDSTLTSAAEPVAGELRRDTLKEQPSAHGDLDEHDHGPKVPALSSVAIDRLVGRYVRVRYVGQTGPTTFASWVADVDVDGGIELDALPGHSFPRSTVTSFDDEDEHQPPAVRPPNGEPRPVPRDAWRREDSRRDAPEQVYGRFWTFDDPADFHSIIWNSGTGELYTYRPADTTVLVRAIGDSRDAVDALLDDWPRRQIEACSGYQAASIILSASGAGRPPDPLSPLTGGEPVYGVVVYADGRRDVLAEPVTARHAQAALGVATTFTETAYWWSGLPDDLMMYVTDQASRATSPNHYATRLLPGRQRNPRRRHRVPHWPPAPSRTPRRPPLRQPRARQPDPSAAHRRRSAPPPRLRPRLPSGLPDTTTDRSRTPRRGDARRQRA